jgi:hypothetical protein
LCGFLYHFWLTISNLEPQDEFCPNSTLGIEMKEGEYEGLLLPI